MKQAHGLSRWPFDVYFEVYKTKFSEAGKQTIKMSMYITGGTSVSEARQNSTAYVCDGGHVDFG